VGRSVGDAVGDGGGAGVGIEYCRTKRGVGGRATRRTVGLSDGGEFWSRSCFRVGLSQPGWRIYLMLWVSRSGRDQKEVQRARGGWFKNVMGE